MKRTEKAVEFIESEFNVTARSIDPKLVVGNIFVRMKSGRKVRDFSAQDWMEIFGLSEEEVMWDNVRHGLEVTFAYDEDPAETANSIVSGMKEVRFLYRRFRAGELGEVDFLYESEWACLDAVVNILASYLRSTPINIKALDIIITDEMLSMRYAAIKDEISGEWAAALEHFEKEQHSHNEMLEKKYTDYVKWLKEDLDTYMRILPRAFSDKPEEALAGSAELASFLRLPQAKVLDSLEGIDNFFLD